MSAVQGRARELARGVAWRKTGRFGTTLFLFVLAITLMKDLDVRLEAKVRHGMVLEEILDEATRGDFDVVVVGAHEVRGWRRLLVEDPVQQLLLQGDRPILIV